MRSTLRDMDFVSEVSPEKWNSIAETSPEGTFFHTYTWAKVLKESFGFDIATKLFVFDDGTEVLFPLMRTFTKFKVFREFYSMPLSTYGGPLPSNIDNGKLAKILSIFKPTDFVSIIPNPLFFQRLWKDFDHLEVFTQILPLTEGFDDVWNNRFAGKVRNQCRRAERESYDISVNNSLEAFMWFSDTYNKAAGARGETPYSFSLYQAMHDNAGEHIKLWCATKEGRLAGCLPALYGPRDVFYWSIAVEPEHAKYSLNNLLLKVAIEDACKRGYQFFNLGASSVGGKELESLIQYKKSFGGERINYPIYLRTGYLYRLSRTIYRAVRIW